jgi:hypothetical protein
VVSEPGNRELLREWRKVMDSIVASVASVGGRSDLARQLVEPMQHQLELVQELIERERRMQKEVAGRLLAPADALFDLLEETGQLLRRQAEALEAAGRALEDTAGLALTQAELFERTIAKLRKPAESARAVAGLEPRVRKSDGGKSRRRRSA